MESIDFALFEIIFETAGAGEATQKLEVMIGYEYTHIGGEKTKTIFQSPPFTVIQQRLVHSKPNITSFASS